MNNYDESFHSPSPLPGTLLGASHTAKDLILPTILWVQCIPCREEQPRQGDLVSYTGWGAGGLESRDEGGARLEDADDHAKKLVLLAEYDHRFLPYIDHASLAHAVDLKGTTPTL